MKEIYFIRHGQTNENSLGIRQGSEINSELNELGREQEKKTGKYLKKYLTSWLKIFNICLALYSNRLSQTMIKINIIPWIVEAFITIVILNHPTFLTV